MSLKASFFLKYALLKTERNGESVLQNWQHMTTSNCNLGGFPTHLEVESGFHLYFNLPGLKLQCYDIMRKDGNRKWNKTWVLLSLRVQVHRYKGYCTWGWLNVRQFLCRNLQAALPPGSPHCPASTLLLWFIAVSTANLSIVPTYPTWIHITEMVKIRRNKLSAETKWDLF